jgi:hypothetical protein
MVPLVGIMNIMKIKQCQIHWKIYEYKVWFTILKCIKTCCSFQMKPNFKTFTICNLDVYKSRTWIIIINSCFKILITYYLIAN